MSEAENESPTNDSPLRSVHSESLTELFSELGVSVAISTYQAGHVVLLRNDQVATNTHFRAHERPMGLAYDSGRLAVGRAHDVVVYHNMVEVAGNLPGPMAHDACFMPRHSHLTGDIDIHEMAWGRSENEESGGARLNELWIINTRFSCLCTLNAEHSFVPRWRPKFVNGLSPQDRCHLNGLALVDGKPKYATALGTADAAHGWRKKKANGGCLIDIETDELIVEGLSMPHSPRWYEGQLWLLESGDGTIGKVDVKTGRYEPVCQLNGFTRGLDFWGPFAFVGISQVRESAVFSGIPITQRLDERVCGMSVVDLRNGNEIALMHFEEAVQEVFAVQVLPFKFPEIIASDDDLVGKSWALPDEALGEVKWLAEESDSA